jgi:hypothetical protein
VGSAEVVVVVVEGDATELYSAFDPADYFLERDSPTAEFIDQAKHLSPSIFCTWFSCPANNKHLVAFVL